MSEIGTVMEHERTRQAVTLPSHSNHSDLGHRLLNALMMPTSSMIGMTNLCGNNLLKAHGKIKWHFSLP